MANQPDPNALVQMAQAMGRRNRAGAPITPQAPSKGAYDAFLALRLLTAAHEVMQRVVTDPGAKGLGDLEDMMKLGRSRGAPSLGVVPTELRKAMTGPSSRKRTY